MLVDLCYWVNRYSRIFNQASFTLVYFVAYFNGWKSDQLSYLYAMGEGVSLIIHFMDDFLCYSDSMKTYSFIQNNYALPFRFSVILSRYWFNLTSLSPIPWRRFGKRKPFVVQCCPFQQNIFVALTLSYLAVTIYKTEAILVRAYLTTKATFQSSMASFLIWLSQRRFPNESKMIESSFIICQRDKFWLSILLEDKWQIFPT